MTPSCDDPTSHAVLDDTLYAISQICHGVNEVKDNPERLRLLEIQSRLRERLDLQCKVIFSLIDRKIIMLMIRRSAVLYYSTFSDGYLCADHCTLPIGPETGSKANMSYAYCTSRAWSLHLHPLLLDIAFLQQPLLDFPKSKKPTVVKVRSLNNHTRIGTNIAS